MKNKAYVAVWGTVTALSLAAFTLPIYAADQESSGFNTRTNRTRTDRTPGEWERANKVIGKRVLSADNQKLGSIENVIVDLESGRVLYAVVDTGLVGKKYAVPAGMFSHGQGDAFHVNIDKEKLSSAPEFTRDIDKPEQLGQASYVNSVYQHFGQSPWWQGPNAPANAGSFNNVHKASELTGMKVKNVSNEDFGKVDNAILDLPAGRIVYVILSPDSHLNLGNNLYALPPNALTLSSDHKFLVSDITREKLATAPHFTKDQWSNISNPAFATKVYQFYGKDAWFEGSGGLKPTGRTDDKVYPRKQN